MTPFRVALFTALCAGCYFFRSAQVPLPVLDYPRHPGTRARCLVVFAPGFGDGADEFARHRFIQMLRASGADADAVAADLHYRYYTNRTALDRLYTDVLAPARRDGYRSIWLVGISMGGLGAISSAAAHPDAVDGVVLLGPYLGDREVIDPIVRAGGLRTWHAGDPTDFYQRFWVWSQAYADHSALRPPLYLFAGADDGGARAHHVLAAVLPDGHVRYIPGGHDWDVWEPLWADFLGGGTLRETCAPGGSGGP